MYRVNMKHRIRMLHYSFWVAGVVGMIAAAVISGCFFGTATNLCNDRRCNPGQTCAANQDICIDIDGCGDGIISPEKGEICDDGNIINGDGCSADCKSNESCGNGILDADETCDDNNTVSGDGCSADCHEETCGDGIYNPANNEQCDTRGDTQACNGASGFCSLPTCGHCTTPRCGDGYTNVAFIPFMAIAPEECDEVELDISTDPPTTKSIDSPNCNGNNNGPGSCRIPLCGDGYINPMFKPGGQDGTKSEFCDTGGDSPDCNGGSNIALRSDGTFIQSNNKDSECQIPKCGDGYVNPMFKPNPKGMNAEACDTGGDTQKCNGVSIGDNPDFPNNIDAQCQIPKCGDRYVNKMFKPNPNGTKTEICDTGDDSDKCNGNGNGNPLNDINAQCQIPKCGDGYTNTAFKPDNILPEECDDGDFNDDKKPDACRRNCRKHFCGDGVKDSDEQCDFNAMVIPCGLGICSQTCQCM